MGNTSKKMFKKSAFGGFNREDVANYITSLSDKHAAEIDKIRDELKNSATENVELKNGMSELSAECKALKEKVADYEEMTDVLAQTKAELERVCEERKTLLEEKNVLEAQLESATEELNALREREQEVKKSKERIADLELEARRRVAEAEELARAKMEADAERQRADMEAQLSEFNTYRDEKYAEVARNVSDVADAYQTTKAAVATFKTDFKGVVADLAREIDSLSEASLAVEQAFASLNEESKAKTE